MITASIVSNNGKLLITEDSSTAQGRAILKVTRPDNDRKALLEYMQACLEKLENDNAGFLDGKEFAEAKKALKKREKQLEKLEKQREWNQQNYQKRKARKTKYSKRKIVCPFTDEELKDYVDKLSDYSFRLNGGFSNWTSYQHVKRRQWLKKKGIPYPSYSDTHKEHLKVVKKLLGKGWSTKEIGNELGCTSEQIRTNRENIIKLGI